MSVSTRRSDGRLSVRSANSILERIGRLYDAECTDPERHICPLPHTTYAIPSLVVFLKRLARTLQVGVPPRATVASAKPPATPTLGISDITARRMKIAWPHPGAAPSHGSAVEEGVDDFARQEFVENQESSTQLGQL